MVIRKLDKQTLKDAIRLKVECWQEEINGCFVHHLNYDEEYIFWSNWMDTAQEHNDVRTLLGAFDNTILTGVIFASFAEDAFGSDAIEINGLWVNKDYRGQQISLKLLAEILPFYQNLNKHKVIIYNHKYAPSNDYYKAIGGKIIACDSQLEGRLLVDIFEFNTLDLNHLIREKIKNA
ncbi:MAG: GNAT family N-acetyltransferase [Candidatus Izemoplasmataceae bacterium]